MRPIKTSQAEGRGIVPRLSLKAQFIVLQPFAVVILPPNLQNSA